MSNKYDPKKKTLQHDEGHMKNNNLVLSINILTIFEFSSWYKWSAYIIEKLLKTHAQFHIEKHLSENKWKVYSNPYIIFWWFHFHVRFLMQIHKHIPLLLQQQSSSFAALLLIFIGSGWMRMKESLSDDFKKKFLL